MSLAILGKNDEPLYLREFYATDDDERIAEEELFGLPSHPDGTATDDNKKKGSTVFDCSLRQQFILHAALDRFEQLSGPPPGFAWRKPGVVGTDAMFVGLLCPVEHLRVYGESFPGITSLLDTETSTRSRMNALTISLTIVFRLHDNNTHSILAHSGGSTARPSQPRR